MKLYLDNEEYVLTKKEIKTIIKTLNLNRLTGGYGYSAWHFWADLLFKNKIAKQKYIKSKDKYEWFLLSSTSK